MLKVGDEVIRIMGGQISMRLKVTQVTDTLVICGDWEFDRETGLEIDDMLGWTRTQSGSYLVLPYSKD